MIRFFVNSLLVFSFLTSFHLPIIAQSSGPTQSPESLNSYSEEEFLNSLTSYVKELFTDYALEILPQERFLISLMRLVNDEMNHRTDRKAVSKKYYGDIERQLQELSQMKGRLKNAGISDLDAFVNELEIRMKYALESDDMDFKKKKVFDDALQLLYVAEEMIKLDQLSDTSNLNQKISSSKSMLLDAFGEVNVPDNTPLDIEPTIFNLFNEWRITDYYKFSARLTDVKIARLNLIKSASVQETSRMFKAQLKYAYESFNYFDYDLADRHFEDLVNTYKTLGIKDFEDVLFYWGEANFAMRRMLRADEIFSQLIQQYPTSAYLSRVYARLVEINYNLEKYDAALKYFSQYQTVASTAEPDFYDIHFIAALSFYNQADYNRAVEILSSFPQSSEFYYFAQYLVGKVYAAGQNYDLAFDAFDAIVNSKKSPEEFRYRSLLKLAQISYERSAYLQAISYADNIPEDFSRYDRVLNLLAWSYFMSEKNTQEDPSLRDFSVAKKYAQRLIDEYYGSEYRIEAKSLLGYIYQLENRPSLARNYYKNVYDAKMNRGYMQQHLLERDSLLTLYNENRSIIEQALRNDNREVYQRARAVEEDLQQQILEMDYAELSSIGVEMSEEIAAVLLQIDELNVLREDARAAGNTIAMSKIDSIIARLKSSIELIPGEFSQQAIMYSAFPISRRVANNLYLSQKNNELQNEILNEIQTIDDQINSLNTEVQKSKLIDDYAMVVSLEQKIQHLQEIRKRYDALYLESFELYAGEPYADFDRWGDFGAIGIIDVDFGQRDRLRNRMSGLSSLYNSIIDKLTNRREYVEDQIKKIEAEIRFMTMKARLEERQRLRAQREQSFRETYFDTRTSEFEEK